MLDIRLFREQPDLVREGLRKVGEDPAMVNAIVQADERRRRLLVEVEQLKAERNAVSKQIGAMRDKAARDARIAEMRAVGDRIAALDQEVAGVDAELQRLMLLVPNLPDEAVPVGSDESENVIVREVGTERHFDFDPKPHWELGPALDIIDFERGIKISGSRFYVLKGAGARLQRALISFMLDVHTLDQDYIEVYPPFVVKEVCLYGTGNLPKFGDNLYHDYKEDFWLIPTAEVPVTNLYRDEILDGSALPIKHVAYTPCWRREQMRFRPEPGAKPEYVHTLNGSGLALPRIMIAVLENYQRADGSVEVPEVLRSFMRCDVIERPW